MSFTTCAATFPSGRSVVVSRYASASRIGKAALFHARSIVLALNLWTFSSICVNLAVPRLPGLYHAEAAELVIGSTQLRKSCLIRAGLVPLIACSAR
jgi:hypothetical protein